MTSGCLFLPFEMLDIRRSVGRSDVPARPPLSAVQQSWKCERGSDAMEVEVDVG